MRIVIISRPPLKALTRKFSVTRHHILKRIAAQGDEVIPLDIAPARVRNPYLSYGLGVLLAPWRFRGLRADVVLADDLESGLAAVLIKLLYRVPLVFNFLDDYALIASYEGRGLRFKLLRWLEKAVPRMSDGIIAVDKPKERWFLGQGTPPAKVRYVANGADLAVYKPGRADRALKDKLGLERSPVVLFVGKMNKYYELGNIVRSIPAVLKVRPRTKFLFVGDGDDRAALEDLAARLGVRDAAVFAGFQPAPNIPRLINLAEVCVFPLPDSSALAIFEYMACAKPVVLPGGGTDKMSMPFDMVPEDCAVHVPPDPEGFARGVVRLLGNATQARAMGRRAEKLVRREYDWDILAPRFRSVLAEFARPGAHRSQAGRGRT